MISCLILATGPLSSPQATCLVEVRPHTHTAFADASTNLELVAGRYGQPQRAVLIRKWSRLAFEASRYVLHIWITPHSGHVARARTFCFDLRSRWRPYKRGRCRPDFPPEVHFSYTAPGISRDSESTISSNLLTELLLNSFLKSKSVRVHVVAPRRSRCPCISAVRLSSWHDTLPTVYVPNCTAAID